ncbi:MAG: transporter permease [Acidimicrobiales bacterium]|nr:transporter permease [Acidimicrobiales bacterium]
MWRAELGLLLRRVRIKALLGVLALVPIGVAVAVRVAGGGPDPGSGPRFLDQVSRNGVFAGLAALTVTVPFFLPLAVAVVAGDAVAGEANLGTLRYLLARPYGRTRLLVAKGAAVAIFCLLAGLVVAAAGVLAGVVLFPVGPVTTLSGTTLPLTSGIVRIFGASLLVGASMLGLAAIGLFISTLTDAPVGAMAATAGIAVLSGVLDAVPPLQAIHPWLLTHDWLSFGDLLRSPVLWTDIERNLGLQLVYVAVFASAAWARFGSKDVLA